MPPESIRSLQSRFLANVADIPRGVHRPTRPPTTWSRRARAHAHVHVHVHGLGAVDLAQIQSQQLLPRLLALGPPLAADGQLRERTLRPRLRARARIQRAWESRGLSARLFKNQEKTVGDHNIMPQNECTEDVYQKTPRGSE